MNMKTKIMRKIEDKADPIYSMQVYAVARIENGDIKYAVSGGQWTSDMSCAQVRTWKITDHLSMTRGAKIVQINVDVFENDADANNKILGQDVIKEEWDSVIVAKPDDITMRAQYPNKGIKLVCPLSLARGGIIYTLSDITPCKATKFPDGICIPYDKIDIEAVRPKIVVGGRYVQGNHNLVVAARRITVKPA